ncbi:PTS glucose/sucrose transporter subunit IIB [Corynebacterium hindlerae]|uniref:PTS glucose/sucrose transporter subunit IIB n=1 Tax=Corynebacterium hindlerae TaxID=699041 RepID=A0A7G5FE05_9CORY|nr:PTS glucose/sucrose transporter subunit IIB [Corynebacterium hindlerae]QMV84846.1 PTS glucose/sucrose transporter subunit IIB [Corynebacterium hindlerae]
MDYQSLAKQVTEHVGGSENINLVPHCSTRLRINIADQSKVDKAKLQAIDGVLGVITGPQTQIVIGNNVVPAYEAMIKETGRSGGGSSEAQSHCRREAAVDGQARRQCGDGLRR